MGKSYSEDLRERMVEMVDAGHSRRAAARYYGVSESCAINLVKRRDVTGSISPARQGRPPNSGKLSAFRAFLIDRVKERPDMTLAELAAELKEKHRVETHPSSVSRLLRAAGLTYKKNAAGERMQASRHQP